MGLAPLGWPLGDRGPSTLSHSEIACFCVDHLPFWHVAQITFFSPAIPTKGTNDCDIPEKGWLHDVAVLEAIADHQIAYPCRPRSTVSNDPLRGDGDRAIPIQRRGDPPQHYHDEMTLKWSPVMRWWRSDLTNSHTLGFFLGFSPIVGPWPSGPRWKLTYNNSI